MQNISILIITKRSQKVHSFFAAMVEKRFLASMFRTEATVAPSADEIFRQVELRLGLVRLGINL